jgi:hypothetical protein
MMMAVFFLSSVVGNFAAGLFSGLIPQPIVKEVLLNKASNADEAIILESATYLMNKSENPLEQAVISAFEKSNNKKGRILNREKLEAADTLYAKEATYVNGNLKDGRKVIFADNGTIVANFGNVELNKELFQLYEGNKEVIVRSVVINDVHVGSIIFANSENSLFGFKINTLYSFFIIFIIMSGVTSILLFVLHKQVEKLMHGVR